MVLYSGGVTHNVDGIHMCDLTEMVDFLAVVHKYSVIVDNLFVPVLDDDGIYRGVPLHLIGDGQRGNRINGR